MSRTRQDIYDHLVQRFSRASEGLRVGEGEEAYSRTLAAEALHTIRFDEKKEALERLESLREDVGVIAIPGYALRSRAGLAIAYTRLGEPDEAAEERGYWDRHKEDVWPEYRPIIAALMAGAAGLTGTAQETFAAIEEAVEFSGYIPEARDEMRYRWKGFGAAAAAMTLGVFSADLGDLMANIVALEEAEDERPWLSLLLTCLLAIAPLEEKRDATTWLTEQLFPTVPVDRISDLCPSPVALTREALSISTGEGDRFREELLSIWAGLASIRVALRFGTPEEIRDTILGVTTSLMKTPTLHSRGWFEVALWELASLLDSHIPLDLPNFKNPSPLRGLPELLRGE